MHTNHVSMYIRILFFCFLIGSGIPSLAQPYSPLHSTHGKVHTPKGDLHILVVVIRYEDKNLFDDARWPDSSLPGELPSIFRGDHNQMFSRHADSLGHRLHHNLSDYLYQMSDGQFRVTAEVYPQQVPVTYLPERGSNSVNRQQRMNTEAIRWITEQEPDFDWGRFDRRKNGPNYRYDNRDSRPDNKLDYVIFFHRDHGANGFSSACNIAIPGTEYRIMDGQTGSKNYVDAKHNWMIFLHELAHSVFSAPHYGGANHADGNRYYTQKGWGLMAPWIVPFTTPLAWESWWLGWWEPQEVVEAGRYRLGDLATEKDALRIKLPGCEQYVWLENHQKIDPWDQKLFYRNEEGFSPTAPGVYAYLVAEPGSDRSKPQLGPFNKNHVNMIRFYNGEGNFDYRIAEANSDHRRGKRFPVFEKARPNPIMGQNDFQYIRADFDGDGEIAISNRHGNNDGRKQEDREVWNELRNGQVAHSGNTTGDQEDALLPGDMLGLSGLFPLLNYPLYRKSTQALDSIELNGLQIRMVSQQADGSVEIDVQFQAWDLSQDQRWCGPLVLSEKTGTAPLRILEEVKLTLDLSGTPDRMTLHPETGTFTNPTVLKVKDQREILLEKGSSLTIDAHSQLRLGDSSRLRLTPGSTLRVKKGGSLILEGNSQLQVARRAKVIIERGGHFQAAGPQNYPRARRRLRIRN